MVVRRRTVLSVRDVTQFLKTTASEKLPQNKTSTSSTTEFKLFRLPQLHTTTDQ